MLGSGRNSSFEATITLSAWWGESSLANAREAERTTGGTASRVRIRNFDDGGSRAICESTSPTYCHEGSSSETAVDLISNIASIMTGQYPRTRGEDTISMLYYENRTHHALLSGGLPCCYAVPLIKQ